MSAELLWLGSLCFVFAVKGLIDHVVLLWKIDQKWLKKSVYKKWLNYQQQKCWLSCLTNIHYSKFQPNHFKVTWLYNLWYLIKAHKSFFLYFIFEASIYQFYAKAGDKGNGANEKASRYLFQSKRRTFQESSAILHHC